MELFRTSPSVFVLFLAQNFLGIAGACLPPSPPFCGNCRRWNTSSRLHGVDYDNKRRCDS